MFVIHSQIHAAWPDVVSAAHAHSVHGSAVVAAPALDR
jgi:ribulose-5-phosphate 4-epimerase/fuculose-1-phosphate aldolase